MDFTPLFFKFQFTVFYKFFIISTSNVHLFNVIAFLCIFCDLVKLQKIPMTFCEWSLPVSATIIWPRREKSCLRDFRSYTVIFERGWQVWLWYFPKKRKTKALIRLRGCAGWSAPVLFATPRRQVFSRRCPFVFNFNFVFWLDLITV